MTGYIVRRLLLVIPTMFGVATLVFLVMNMVPGDAVLARIEMGTSLRPEQLAEMRAELGIDRPLIAQYGDWLWGVVRGDLGRSFYTNRPVVDQLRKAIPISLELAILAKILSLALAIPIGVISALRQDSWADYVLRVFSIGMLAAPSFWLGTMAIVFGAYWFLWAPPFGYVALWDDPIHNMKQFLLPAALMGLHSSGIVMRMTRSTVLEVMRQDYVRTARAKGLGQTVIIMRHVLKNAMIPVITIWGTSLAYLLGGSVIMESIFALPGVGLSVVTAIQNSDIPQLQANLLFFALAVAVLNLLIDLSYSYLDPRVRYT